MIYRPTTLLKCFVGSSYLETPGPKLPYMFVHKHTSENPTKLYLTPSVGSFHGKKNKIETGDLEEIHIPNP